MATAIRGYKNQKKIMKKEYIKPEMVVEELGVVHMFTSSVPVDDEEKPGGWFDQAPGRREGRGSWGDLWN